MSERETVTGPEPEPSALAWADRWLQSEQPAPAPGLPTVPGEPPTRSLRSDGDSTGVNTTALAVDPLRFGEYEVLEKIGQGGMGTVYRVRNLQLKRFEALKLITPRHSETSTARVRFEREFQALGKIEHPNIITVYHTGVWQEYPYFTMKYVPGGALSQHLARFRTDPAAVARLMAKVARAVHCLHREQVLHRDLKPHNILLGDDDDPLVADFGLVKHLDEDSDASVTGAPMGTRQYMSPEQTFAQKADYTPACDVWAIGVILYELLAGRRPFDSKDWYELYGQIRAANPTPILAVDPAAPGPLAAVAHRCLGKSPTDRYPSAAAVADDLEAWLSGEAVTATLSVGQPSPRRRRVAVGLCAAVVAAVGVTAVLLRVPGRGEPPAPSGTDRTSPDALLRQFRAGQSVVLIGPRGAPAVEPGVVSASGGTLTDRVGGWCTFGCFGEGVLPLPLDAVPPFRVRGEVAYLSGKRNISSAGLVLSRRKELGPGGWDGFVRVVLLERIDGPNQVPWDAFEVAQVVRPAGAGGTTRHHALLRLTAPRPEHGPRWHRIDVVVTPGEVRAACDDQPAAPLTAAAFSSFLREQPHARQPDSGVSAMTPGIGLYAHDAEAVFRDVSVTPLLPTDAPR